jgi:hypothetical protein
MLQAAPSQKQQAEPDTTLIRVFLHPHSFCLAFAGSEFVRGACVWRVSVSIADLPAIRSFGGALYIATAELDVFVSVYLVLPMLEIHGASKFKFLHTIGQLSAEGRGSLCGPCCEVKHKFTERHNIQQNRCVGGGV